MARNPRIVGGDKTGIQLGSFYNYDVATEGGLTAPLQPDWLLQPSRQRTTV